MKIRQQIGDRAGEAATWHNLAQIDLNKGDYQAAREKFEKSMKIRQQIGDRAGEAATFYQLGILAWEQGRSQEGLRLVAFMLAYSCVNIGHADAKKSFKASIQHGIGAQIYSGAVRCPAEGSSRSLHEGPRPKPDRCRLPQSLTSACLPAIEIAPLSSPNLFIPPLSSE